MGITNILKRIVPIEALKSGRLIAAMQDGSREFLSLLAAISAAGKVLPPALIYQSDSDTFQDTWLEDWEAKDEAYFAVSPNGWSCNLLGLNWLEKVFDRCTRAQAGNRRRLLIVDSHSSHVNMQFIEKCDELRILLLILPPHSTHRLQPLDVSLFSPLSTYYSNGLNELIYRGLSLTSISKRAFWSVFLPAWKKAFSPTNIASGFRKIGIFPYNPSIIIDIISKPQPAIPIQPSTSPKTPMTTRSIRRLQRLYSTNPSSPILRKLFRANEKLSVQHEIDYHTIQGLQETVKDEIKRKKRGKRLNLVGEDDAGPQFFSPARIERARTFQANKDDKEAQRQQAISDRKAQALAKKHQKEKDKVERARIALERREAKAAENQARLELKKVTKEGRQRYLDLRRQFIEPSKVRKTRKKQVTRPTTAIITQDVEVVPVATSRGRRIQRPQRFAM